MRYKKFLDGVWSFIVRNKKNIGLGFLAGFAMLQILACFVAGSHTEGITSFLFYLVGGITCLFGLALNFLLLIIAVDVFGSIFAGLASDMAKKQAGIEDEEDEDEEDLEEETEGNDA